MFEILPSSFIVTPTFGERGAMPFAKGSSADVYEGAFDGRHVAIKIFRVNSATINSARKVGGLLLLSTEGIAHTWPKAPYQRGCWVEVASPREHLAICRCFVETSTFFDRIGTDGAWQYHELH